MLGLEALLSRRPAQLSGGQRQRVALGRALVRQPQVFLLDEPLSNLDATLRASMRVEIARLHQRLGTTMIYVTHDQVEAMTLGQRIVVLHEGRVQQVDTPMTLYQRPVNRFVATFLGSPAMNLLRGRALHTDGWQLRLADGSQLPLPDSAALDPGWHGRELDCGVRPEHLLVVAGTGPGFDARVDVVEPVGSDIHVNLVFGGQALVARLPPGVLPQAGAMLRLAIAPGGLHVFDPLDGSALTPG